jgi:phosphoribosyl-AMP cyclohydrolase
MSEVYSPDGLNFDDRGLIPAVIQQHDTGEVLMVAWMNAEAVRRTLEEGRTWLWSRSRQEYWCKGLTSGNTQRVLEVRTDCDADVLLVQVDQTGVACHTGERSCFFRVLGPMRAADDPVASGE